MKMQIFEPLKLKFEQPNWANDTELALIYSVLEAHPDLIKMFESDIRKDSKNSVFGRGDVPSVEQIVRCAIYKELKKLDYRNLAYHLEDSRICEQFVKVDRLRPFSFQVLQKYISKITKEQLETLLYELNKIAINEGLEDVSKICMDTTVVETNVHYPTNNSLVWDCIHESHRLLRHLQKEVNELSIRDYTKNAKKTYYLINNTRSSKKKSAQNNKKAEDKRTKLFVKQLVTFTKSINGSTRLTNHQVANIVKKKGLYSAGITAMAILSELEKLLPLMQQVYDFTNRHEVKKERVDNEDKIFSIYELHTDIIVKGSRETKFGHKVNFANGKSNLVLAVETLKGNPADSSLYWFDKAHQPRPMIDKVIDVYGIVPRDSATDGGFASLENLQSAQNKGIVNIVFNKIVGSLRNVCTSLNMETRLKKWRSAIEAIISNVKRGFNLHRCNWKGEAHFEQKVLWSTIAYNIRVMSAMIKVT
jgi:IS5 family transposase